MPIYHGRNTRIGRVSEIGRIYLVTTTTFHRHPTFTDVQLGRLVVREMAQEQADGHACSLAWV